MEVSEAPRWPEVVEEVVRRAGRGGAGLREAGAGAMGAAARRRGAALGAALAVALAGALAARSAPAGGPVGGGAPLPGFEGPIPNGDLDLQLLSLDTGAACLDGSPYGFYFRPAKTGSTRWSIFMQGGGWCYNEAECADRAGGHLGSSIGWPRHEGGCQCYNADEEGLAPTDDCNCLYLPYCDGASFSGHRDDPWPVLSAAAGGSDGAVTQLMFRGLRNLDATLDVALAGLGLSEATELVVTGSSAGGLATFLHADHIVEKVAEEAPGLVKAHALPIVGYFLDHTTFSHDTQNSYPARMEYVFGMQNVGSSGAVSPYCLSAYPEDPHLCFLAPHLLPFIETPLFVLNSKYDQWQLTNELQSDWKTEETQSAVEAYGNDFLSALLPLVKETGNGGFITSCICHGCAWDKLSLNGTVGGTPISANGYSWYALWASGLGEEGVQVLAVDPRGPNGDGAVTLDSCAAFPGP